MSHKAIFLATCNTTNAALQVARKNSCVTPHFATATVALRVARKVEQSSTFCNLARQDSREKEAGMRDQGPPFQTLRQVACV